MEQRAVDDIGMADDPAHVGGGPEDLSGLNAVYILHAPGEHDCMSAVVAHHALGLARRAGGIEDIKRVCGGDGHAIMGRGIGHGLAPVDVATLHELASVHGPLQDYAMI